MGAAIDYKSTDTVLAKARAAGIPTLYGNGQGEDSAARDAFVFTAGSISECGRRNFGAERHTAA